MINHFFLRSVAENNYREGLGTSSTVTSLAKLLGLWSSAILNHELHNNYIHILNKLLVDLCSYSFLWQWLFSFRKGESTQKLDNRICQKMGQAVSLPGPNRYPSISLGRPQTNQKTCTNLSHTKIHFLFSFPKPYGLLYDVYISFYFLTLYLFFYVLIFSGHAPTLFQLKPYYFPY